VTSAAGRAIKDNFSPEAVVMLARGLRMPHYHLMLIPARSGEFLAALFSLMDAVQGFPISSRGDVLDRYRRLGASLGVPTVSEDELEEDARILRTAMGATRRRTSAP
jgi:histidine triad (HIT) family protein